MLNAKDCVYTDSHIVPLMSGCLYDVGIMTDCSSRPYEWPLEILYPGNMNSGGSMEGGGVGGSTPSEVFCLSV